MNIITIHVHVDAPAKPVQGEPCNGCGVCCLHEPCPIGVLLTRRRTGACVALRWDASTRLYRCGMLTSPKEVMQQHLPSSLRVLAPWVSRWPQAWFRRWIAADSACDCDLLVEPAPPASKAQ